MGWVIFESKWRCFGWYNFCRLQLLISHIFVTLDNHDLLKCFLPFYLLFFGNYCFFLQVFKKWDNNPHAFFEENIVGDSSHMIAVEFLNCIRFFYQLLVLHLKQTTYCQLLYFSMSNILKISLTPFSDFWTMGTLLIFEIWVKKEYFLIEGLTLY